MRVTTDMSRARIRSLVALALVGFWLLPTLGCGGSKRVRKFRKSEVQKYLRKLEAPGLVMGEFPLKPNAIIDGDTVKVEGLKTTMRLLGIDTEETFKKEKERRLYEAGWSTYLKKVKGKSRKPVKAATPLGMDAKYWAEDFFKGIASVRLERDHPKEIRGRYNRYLTYVFAHKNGRWINYNIECVRAGMSPYFTKYGYSRRFHDEFVAAQKEARDKQLGIWAPLKRHYDDYPERLTWWNARADFIQKFEEESKGREDFIVLTNWDSLRRLDKHVDKQVTILATVGDIKLGDRGPTRVMLGRRMFGDFPVIFWDKDIFGSSNIPRYKGEYVRVTATVTKYYNKYRKRDELQVQVNLASQIVGSDKVPNYSGWTVGDPVPAPEEEKNDDSDPE